jgi:hypothetical protein
MRISVRSAGVSPAIFPLSTRCKNAGVTPALRKPHISTVVTHLDTTKVTEGT